MHSCVGRGDQSVEWNFPREEVLAGRHGVLAEACCPLVLGSLGRKSTMAFSTRGPGVVLSTAPQLGGRERHPGLRTGEMTIVLLGKAAEWRLRAKLPRFKSGFQRQSTSLCLHFPHLM